MKILPISDLHFDNNGLSRINSWMRKLGDADVAIIAGDFATLNFKNPKDKALRNYKSVLEEFSKKYEHTLIIPGNHEYWCNSFHEVDEFFRVLAKSFPNVTYLEPYTFVVIKGQRFLGCTLFFPKGEITPGEERSWCDFAHVEPQEIYSHNKEWTDWLRKEVKEDDVVVTHHNPSFALIKPKYKFSCTNRYFVATGCHEIIEEKKPKLWIFGHCHDFSDDIIESTRCYCNPIKYEFENNGLPVHCGEPIEI